MKLRTLAIAALSGLCAVSLAYADSAGIDDANGLDMADSANTSNLPANQLYAMNNSSDNIGGVQNAEMSPSNGNSSSTDKPADASTNPSSNDTNVNDDISADTATGDDDY